MEAMRIKSALSGGFCVSCTNSRHDLCPKCGQCKTCGCISWCLHRER